MFSNLRNSTLPAHIIQQIKTTEDAVRNTHKLVLEQQEIQNTLSPNKYKQQVPSYLYLSRVSLTFHYKTDSISCLNTSYF